MTRVFLDFRVRRGGVGRYGHELAAALQVEGIEVHRFTGREGPVGRVTTAPFTPWGRRAAGRAASSWGAELFHGLHLELPPPQGIPAVVTVHDLCPLEVRGCMPGPHRRAVFRRIVEISLRRAARVLVPSTSTADSIRRHFGVSDAVRVVPPAVAATFRRCSEDEKERARGRFADGRRYIASLWHHKPHKNVAVLRQAAALTRDRLALDWVWSGAAPSRGAVARPLTDDELRLFYGGAEVFVSGSLLEGFGLPIVEALACGTPAVCGECVGALGVAGAGVVVADVSSPDAVADAVASIVEDPDRRARLVERGLSAARALSPERMARETAAVYREVLASGGM